VPITEISEKANSKRLKTMQDPMEVDDNDDDNNNVDIDIDNVEVDDDIDPIDGGPKHMQQPPVLKIMSPLPTAPTLVPLLTMINNSSNNTSTSSSQLSKEEEARLAIDMLRNEDVASRVAAAHRLDAVAVALGEERTRNVCIASKRGQTTNYHGPTPDLFKNRLCISHAGHFFSLLPCTTYYVWYVGTNSICHGRH
jgi:hypothetical protein